MNIVIPASPALLISSGSEDTFDQNVSRVEFRIHYRTFQVINGTVLFYISRILSDPQIRDPKIESPLQLHTADCCTLHPHPQSTIHNPHSIHQIPMVSTLDRSKTSTQHSNRRWPSPMTICLPGSA